MQAKTHCSASYPEDKELVCGGFECKLREGARFCSGDCHGHPILDFVQQLKSDGARFSTIRSGDRATEGVLLTISPLQGVLAKMREFCRERRLRCSIEFRSPRLAVAILGDQDFEQTWELHLFTSKYGDFAGLKFSLGS